MNDSEQTILSSQGADGVLGTPPQSEKPQRNPLLIIGGIGCALLLCAGLLIGGGYFLVQDRVDAFLANVPGEEEATPAATPTVMSTATLAPESETSEDTDATPESDSGDTDTGDATPTSSADDTPVTGEPELGTITFALGATEDTEPIDPGTSFEGEVTEIHAIFEYSGLSSDYNWERVWYLDGDEMLRSADAWSGPAEGVFDLYLNAGGDPLAPGEWTLELSVEGELLATDSFTIIGEEPEVAAVEDTATPTSTPTHTPAPTSPPAPTRAPATKTYKLAYTKWDGGQHNLFIGDTDGSSEQFIMHRAAGPSWTPNGNSIFFFGEPGVNQQDRGAFPDVGNCELPGVSDGIVTIDIASPPTDICVSLGDVYQGLGWNDGTARWASVAPNGEMVAYDAKPGGDYRIYFLGTEGNKQYDIEIVGEQGDWSPDSQKMVYRSGRDGKTGIWISNRDDSGHTLITNANDSFPTWSFDGETIAFSREEDGNVDIYTVNVDGSNPQRLTDAPGPDSLPIYTPSGQIIFRSARSGSWAIWKMNGDGSRQEEIIPNAGVGPDWAYSKMSVLP